MSNVGGDMSWHDVPPEYSEAWRAVFWASHEGLDLKMPCPVCGFHELHRWYLASRRENRMIDGYRFVARGSEWQWCSHCRSFQHFSGLVPEWWSCDLDVDVTKLTAYPDAIEIARRKRETTKSVLGCA